MKKSNLLSVVLAMTIYSCQQDDTLENHFSKEDAAREIGFVNICDLEVSQSRSSVDSDINQVEYPSLGIKARIARKKTGCQKGFGLCDIRAAHSQEVFTKFQTRNISADAEKYTCTTICTIDNNGTGFMYFLLADSPESQGLSVETMPQFCIDEKIEQPIEEFPNYSLIVTPGAYIYKQTLGQHGGYAVKVTYYKPSN